MKKLKLMTDDRKEHVVKDLLSSRSKREYCSSDKFCLGLFSSDDVREYIHKLYYDSKPPHLLPGNGMGLTRKTNRLWKN